MTVIGAKYWLYTVLLIACYLAVLFVAAFAMTAIYNLLGLNAWQPLSFLQALLYVSLFGMVIGFVAIVKYSSRVYGYHYKDRG